MGTKLMKSNKDKKICGVCGGIAEYLHIDSTLVRIIWAIAVCCFGSGILLYFIAALIMPQDFGYSNNNWNNRQNGWDNRNRYDDDVVYDNYNTNYESANNTTNNTGYYSSSSYNVRNTSGSYPTYNDRR